METAMPTTLPLDHDVINPFIEATVKVLETMAFIRPVLGTTLPWDSHHSAAEVAGIVGLTNKEDTVRGFMSVGFTQGSICQIVSNMLGEEFTAINHEIREAVGEIANMISGQARQGLSARGIKLQASLPSVVSGQHMLVEGKQKIPMVLVNFSVDSGPLELGICFDGLA
jgi:chemotaxis protein CheX